MCRPSRKPCRATKRWLSSASARRMARRRRVVDLLNKEINAALKDPGILAKLKDLGGIAGARLAGRFRQVSRRPRRPSGKRSSTRPTCRSSEARSPDVSAMKTASVRRTCAATAGSASTTALVRPPLAAAQIGYDAEDWTRQAGHRHHQYLERHQSLPRASACARREREARRAAGRRLPDRIAGDVAAGDLRQAHHHALSQFAGDGDRGTAAQPSARRRGADGRLRQDHARPA